MSDRSGQDDRERTDPPQTRAGHLTAHRSDEWAVSPLRSHAPLRTVSTDAYELRCELATGGMGRVLAAHDLRHDRSVAIKELLTSGGGLERRFEREALITARLQHPSIVPVYEAGRWPTGEPFFAMKLVSGRPLDRVIGETSKLEDRLAIIPRLAAACDAMAYAHSQRIIHRD